MARGGINKALVAKARESVLAKGENPSIDAVRIELGNTGSKSTIHRYLKELEEEASTRLDDEALLSQPIKELVARLASRLQEEAQGIVEESKSRYERKTKELSDRCAALAQEAGQLADQNNALEHRLNETSEKLTAKSAARSEEHTSELQSRGHLVCRLLLEKKKK